ncbi:putative shugoshin [Helianthus annuus]|nr:putative shugoshin [Helianthus annuus]
MEAQSVHDSKFNFFTEDEPKVVEKTKGKSKVRGRRTLADISNIPQGFTGLKGHKSGPSSDALSFRKHIDQLQKENAALMKRLAEKNKVIELSGTEMQKLRVTLEKVKEQNLQLAQSNNQMLEEARSHKERQKALNHELGCKNGLIVARNLELEGKDIARMCQADDIGHNKVTEPEETEVCTVAEGDADKHSTNGRRQISKSLVHSNKTIQVNDKGKTKRRQRRQSAKFKLDEPKPTLDALKINNTDAAAADDEFKVDEPKSTQDSLKINSIDAAAADDDDRKLKADDSSAGTSSSSSSSSSKTEDKEGDSFQDNNKPCEHRKTSLSRPVREAAKKVQSYKEINLVVKMRRE